MVACLGNNSNKENNNQPALVQTLFVPGEVWKDTKGIPIQAHRGRVTYQEGVYYWHGENSTGDINRYSSKDLLNWTLIETVSKDESGAACYIYNPTSAIFKYNNKYYKLSLKPTAPGINEAEIAVTDSMSGKWSIIGNPCIGPDADKAFFAQSCSVIPVQGKEGVFIAMFDRCDKPYIDKPCYLWLPIIFEDDRPTIPWQDYWDMTVFIK